jgi:type I restriction-modification system DNA methylase subunit
LNTGYAGKQHDIFAYNGGLFAPDEILDNIKIDDSALCDATLALSNYDYNSEVDVNILGHIFEHSLTEIEELEREITSTDLVETKTSKRKKDGVFYTPKYITKYIVENTVGTLCKNKKEELNLQEEDYHKLTKKAKKQLYENLMQYREWLLHITIIDPACGSGAFLNQALEFLIAEHRGIAELEANIFNAPMVFDVESSILENNLFGVDINEESVEIAKLSLWLRTAKKGRKLNSLNNNIKCGNSLIDDPAVAGDKAFNWQEQFPHIFEKGGFDVVIGNPPYVQITENKQYYDSKYSTSKSGDLYALFYEKGNFINKLNGYFGFITPSLFIKGIQYESLRNLLIQKFDILILDDLGDGVFNNVNMPTAILIAKNNINENQNWNNFIGSNDIISKIDLGCISLGEITSIMRGLEIGKDKTFHKGEVPIITGEDCFRFGYKKNLFISFKIFEEYKKKAEFFNQERIVIRETGNRITSFFVSETIEQNRSLYSVIKTNKEYSYYYLLGIINSELLQFYYKTKFASNTDVFPKIRIVQCKQLPIKIITQIEQKSIVEKVKTMLSNNKELQQSNTQFQKLLSSKFENININTKLEKWYELSFADFNKELSKQKIKLSLSEQSEWLTFFEEEKQKALAIKNGIDKTDKEIDQMVYQLYGLTDEEIKIVEGIEK